MRANSQKEIFDQAHLIISGKISDCKKGSIALLEIEEALAEVNDEIEPIIGFVEKGLPHCGLVYLTPRQEKIQEAKATLCFLAKNRLSSVKTIVETATKTAHLKAPD
ncbi:hypothetical protein [Paraburkholderia tropica]|uniref:hypothetical protein n=1 Tax=Paraburkholderia tropica TaxID=92647 RepID=UPI002AB65A9E|nr:hypothetical protein [Paraburkholderia tropica]